MAISATGEQAKKGENPLSEVGTIMQRAPESK
jgi:hypothetical protein